ncbi:putative membrane protein [Wickerhamomyces ciferrii]|uniref:Membrane protein n=1 Tax=Wickerhamomyces ciferrii (strain ATCC 14091 / BCRC 22168 / CBS 111 / JCM 3599 / NBRC 0793 / NRRL Y-1031 F-60-10) TaxID=1206466 RepID=K0KMS3_WICCF|nr:uncharacterized protein BN7_1963 [Wickerhamomyces ciferrii]CCH42418.1 putative membrane protein [Wickerhamomyces ciferrii]
MNSEAPENEESLSHILPENHSTTESKQDKLPIDSKQYENQPKAQNRILKELKLLSILTFFAIIGVLARKGIVVLTTYDGVYVGGIIWANFTSCIIMGMLIQSNKAWTGRGPKASQPLYTGLTTGFCGTFSSFSSLILESFVKSANISIGKNYNYPNGAYGIMEFASVIITQMSVSIAGLHFGKHLIKQYDPILPYYKVLETSIVILGILSWIAVICLISIKNWRSWIFACIVSPIACWTRYYASKYLNPKIKSFPMGTFFVNIFSTFIMAILNLLNRGKLPNGSGRIVNSVLSCHMIQGLEDGYCGTLSTVSTFVVELYTIKSPKSYRYGFISIIVAFIMMLLILGSYNWTNGLTNPLCS